MGTGGLANSSDTFTIQIGSLASVNTSGTSGIIGDTGDKTAVTGTAYTIKEVALSSGTNLAQYSSTLACTDSAGLQSSLPNGAVFNASTGTTITPVAGAKISCTITNTPKAPFIAISKALGAARLNNNDQFIVQWVNGGNSVVATSSAATIGTGSTITSGGSLIINNDAGAAAKRTLGEAMATGSVSTLAQYSTSVSCTNSTPGGSVVSTVAKLGDILKPIYGDVINCTITNTPLVNPTLSARLYVSGNTKSAGPWSFTVSGTNGWGTQTLTNTVVYPASSLTSAISLSAANTDTTLTLNRPAGWFYYWKLRCVDANYVKSGNPGQVYLSVTTSGDSITLPASLVRPSAVLQCDAAIGQSSITVNEALGSARINDKDQFTAQISTGGTVVNTTTNSTTLGTGNQVTAGSGTTGIVTADPVAAPGTVYTLNQGFATGSVSSAGQYSSSVSCTNVSGGTNVSGITSLGQTITPADGDIISCTITNRPNAGIITVTKALGAARINNTDQFTVQIKNSVGTVVSASAGATTTGTGATVDANTGTTGTFSAAAGSDYTLTEIAASGSLGAYSSTVSCSNATSGGSNVSGIKQLGDTVKPLQGDVISCTITNSPKSPVITVTKALGAARINDQDQFIVQWINGGNGGIAASSPTTVGTGSAITSGGSVTINNDCGVGCLRMLGETLGTGSVSTLAQYSTSVSCTNSTAGGSDVSGVKKLGDILKPIYGDVINCTITNSPKSPVITVTKALGAARINDQDQFIVQWINGGNGGIAASSPTTVGTGSAITSGGSVTINNDCGVGCLRMLGETLGTGSVSTLAQYSTSVSCTNSTTGGSDVSGVKKLGDILKPIYGDVINCTITNTPKAPTVSVTKTLGGNRINSTDQFTVQWVNNQNGVPFGANTTTGTGSTVTTGTGTTGAQSVCSGCGVYVGELMATGSGSTLGQYTASLSCTNTTTGQLLSGVTKPGDVIAPVNGDVINCTITNTPKAPTISLKKQVGTGGLANSSDTFTIQIGSLASANTSGTIGTIGDTGIKTAVAGTAYTIKEVALSSGTNLAQYSSALTCTDSANIQTTALPNNAVLTSAGIPVTPVAGSQLVCTMINTAAAPTLSLSAVLGGAGRVNTADQFAIAVKTGGLNGTSVASATTTGTGTAATGTATLSPATTGTSYTLTQAAASGARLNQYSSTLTCTDSAGVQSGLPNVAAFDPTVGYAIAPVAGANISCVITNTPKKLVITINKVLGGNRINGNDQFRLALLEAGTPVVAGTTTGVNNIVDAATSAITYTGTAGRSYSFTETIVSGTPNLPGVPAPSVSNLSQYSVSVSCANTATGGTAVSGITALNQSFTAAAGDVINCTITNTPKAPVIKVSKALGGNRINGNDQFRLALFEAGTPVVAGTTTGVNNIVDAATSAITYTGTAGRSYSFTETIVSGTPNLPGVPAPSVSNLSQYSVSVSCANTATGGTAVSGITALNQSFTAAAGDVINCAITNTPKASTINLKKQVGTGGLANSSDTFTIQIGSLASANTSGTSGTIGDTGIKTAVAGTAYTIKEVALSSGTNLAQYSSALTCTDSANIQTTALPNNAVLTSAGIPVTPVAGAQLVCTIINTAAAPTLTVTKALGTSGRVNSTDQFTVQIQQGGTPVVVPGVSTSTGSGSTITASTGTTGVATLTAGTSYTINEAVSGTTNLSQYSAAVGSCTNSLTTSTTAIPTALGTAFTLQAGDAITCTLTNAPAAAKLTIKKTTTVGTGAFTFNGSATNANGFSINSSYTVTTTAANTAASGTQVTLTANNVITEVAETVPSNWVLSSATCTDANSAVTGNTGSFGTLSGSTLQIPAANVRPGSDLQCTFTNAPAAAKLTIKKTTTVGTGSFTFNGSTANANGFSTNSSYTVTTTVANTAASGTQVTLAANNVITEVTETVPSNWVLSSATCTDANSAVTGNTGSFGSLSGSTLQIPAANVRPGSDLQCTFTNTPAAAKLTIKKITTAGTGSFTFNGSTANANGFSTNSSYTVTTTAANTAASGTQVTLTANNAITEVTETVPSNWVLSSATCTDANAAVTGNTGAFGTLSGSTLQIPASNVRPGANLQCTFTNAPAAAKLTIKKTTTVGTGAFTFNGSATNANGFSTNSSYTVTTTAANTAASGTQVTLAANNVITEVTETVPSNWVLSSATCTDANSAVTGNTSSFGTLSGSTLQIPAANVRPGADLQCTFTNAPAAAKLTIKKTTTAGTGSFTFNGTTANANGFSTNSSYTVTTTAANTAASGTQVTLTANNAITEVTETVPSNWVLSSASCVDNNAAVTGNTGAFGTLSGSTLQIPASNVRPGSDLQCTFTNAPATAKLTIKKTTTVGTGAFTFNGSATNANGFSTNSSYTVTTTAANTAASGTQVTLTANNVITEVTETVPSNWVLSSATCTDANSAVTGNPGSFGSLSGSTLQIPASNVRPGSDLQCTFTNAPAAAKLTIKKTTTAGTGSFTFNGSTANANGFSTNGSYTVTTTAANTAASGTQVTLTANNAITEVTETVPSNWVLSSATCTDANSAVTGNTSSFGTLNGSTLQIPAANVRPGSDLQCTFTNVPKAPELTVTKALGAGGRANATDQFTVQILQGGTPITVPGTSTSMGALGTITAGTGTTGITTLTTGTSYTINEVASAGTQLRQYNSALNCSNNLAGGTSIPVTLGTAFTPVAGDAITCTLTNTVKSPVITVAKILGAARINDSDQFTVQWVNGGNGIPAVSATTAGTGSTITAGSGSLTVNNDCGVGCFRYVGEVMAVGSVSTLSQYSTSVSCTNTTVGGTNVAGVARLGDRLKPVYGDNISCTITNTPKAPTLTVTKALGTSGRVNSTDQFTVQIQQGGTPVVVPGVSTSTGSGTTITANTGTTGVATLTAGTSYTINEAVSGTTNLSQYSAAVGSCTNSLSTSTTAIPTTLGTAFTLRAGDAITCTLTNTPAAAKLTIKKTTTAGTGSFTFNGSTANANGFSTNSSYTVTTTAANTAASGTQVTLAANNAITEVTETVPSNWVLSSATCTDANSAVTGNTGSFGSLSGSTLQIPASNVRPGANLQCTFTNAPAAAKLTIKKTTTAGTGSFTFNGSTANANGFSTNSSYTVTTTAANTAASGTQVTLTANNVITEVAETVPSNWVLSSASCVDNNAAVTGNTGAFGTLSGSTLQIPASNVRPGSDLQCTFTNAPATTKLTIKKTTTVGTGAFTFNGSTANANGFSTNGSYTVTTTAANTAASGTQVTLIANNTITEVTETVPSNWVLSSATCTDANAAVTGNTGSFGTLNGSTLQIPAANVRPGSDLQCTFTNAPAAAKLTIKKTTTVGTGSFTFNGSTANANGFSTNSSYTVTTTAANTAASGTQVTLTANNALTEVIETVPSNWVLSSATCTDANAAVTGNTGAFGTLSGSTLQISASNVRPGSDLQCTFTNAPAAAKLTIKKTTTVGTGAFTFNGSATNANGFSTNSSYTVTTTAANTAASGTQVTLTANNALTEVIETVPSNWVLSSATCTDANASVTGNPATFGTRTGSTLQIPAANVRSGSDLQCTFTNAPVAVVAIAKITIQKITTVGTGAFTFNGSATNANGFSTNSSYTVTTLTAGAAASGTQVTLTANNTVTEVTETVPANWALSTASCIDTNAAVTGNTTLSFGTLSGTTLKIPAANVRPGADLQCTFTNAPIASQSANLTVVQRTAVTAPAVFNPPVTLSYVGSNGWGPQQISNLIANLVTTGVTQNLTTLNVDTTLTVAVPSSEAGWSVVNIRCTDVNAAASGNPLPPTVLVSSTTNSVTIPAIYVVPKAVLLCAVNALRAK